MEKSFGVDHLLYSVLLSFNHDKQIFTFLCFGVILSVLSYYINYKMKRRRMETIMNRYDGPATLPFIGNATEFLGSTRDLLKKAIKLMKEYKSPFRVWLVNKPYVVISTPEDFQTVAFKTLEKDSSYRFVVDMLGDGIFTSQVEKWKRNRRVINPAFNPAILFHYFLQIFNERNIDLIHRLGKEVSTGKQFDLWPHVIQTSITTICETAMGYKDDNNTEEVMNFGNAIMKSAELVGQRFYKPWLMPSFVFTAYRYLLGYGNVFSIVHNLPLKMLKKRRELFRQIKTENYVGNEQEKTMRNFIDILLNFHEINANFTDKELSDEVISIMFGGSETNAVTNCFCMLMLGMRRDIQDKVY
uniref:Cytochrome P450 380H1 n=1 Tax=Maconellicoccus hirsutus TaxID=177089 RepID=A0AAT9UU53_MACHI